MFAVYWTAHILSTYCNCQWIFILFTQLRLREKLDSLEKLQDIPNHLELLEKILLDSAMETFSALTVSKYVLSSKV